MLSDFKAMVISRTNLWKGNRRIRFSVECWYLLISLRASCPARYLRFFLSFLGGTFTPSPVVSKSAATAFRLNLLFLKSKTGLWFIHFKVVRSQLSMAEKRRFMKFVREKDIRYKYFFLLGRQKFNRRCSSSWFASSLFCPHHIVSEFWV